MLEFENLRPALTALCQELHVVRLDLFGSATGETFGPASDGDVLVEFDPDQGDPFNRYFTLKERLEALFDRPVDVVTARAIRNPYFRAAVEQSRVNVYAA